MKQALIILLLLASLTGQSQNITTVAGNGTFGYSGDGGSATTSAINTPQATAIDRAGNIYVADLYNNRVRKIDTFGIITTIAGTSAVGYGGDGGPATATAIQSVTDIIVDRWGNIYFTDYNASSVRKIAVTGIISTFAGTNTTGYSGDGSQATAAQLSAPNGLACDTFGNILIADRNNNRIRKVSTSGIITTIAGTGSIGFSGDSGIATAANLNKPTSIAISKTGNLYITDWGNNRIRKIDPSGIIITVVGKDSLGFSGDGGPATNARLQYPQGIDVDQFDNLYLADVGNHRIRKVDTAGIIKTIAGTTPFGYSGDGGPATAAKLCFPSGVTVDHRGVIYISDAQNSRIRMIGNRWSTSTTNTKIEPIEVTISPNPTIDAAEIRWNQHNLNNAQYRVTNALGQIMTTDYVNGTKFTINTNGYPKGMYFLQLQTTTASSTIPFIKN